MGRLQGQAHDSIPWQQNPLSASIGSKGNVPVPEVTYGNCKTGHGGDGEVWIHPEHVDAHRQENEIQRNGPHGYEIKAQILRQETALRAEYEQFISQK
jgi:hypothetical protein